MIRFPPRRILVAVDFSAPARFAWAAAQRLASLSGATVEGAYCDDYFPAELSAYPGAPLPAPRPARDLRRALHARFGEDARIRVLRGSPVESLLATAEAGPFDLIVIGTHRRRGAARWMLGSISEAVVRGSRCAVLVVPRAWGKIRRVIAPVHDQAHARRGLIAAGVVARGLEARLTLLHVVTDPIFGSRPQALFDGLTAALPEGVRRDVTVEQRSRTGEPIAEILKECRSGDMIVLAAHRKSILGDFVLGTTIERVIRHSPVPVLSIPTV